MSTTDTQAVIDSMHRRCSPVPYRDALVNRVKAQLAAGTYETPAMHDGTVDRLLASGVLFKGTMLPEPDMDSVNRAMQRMEDDEELADLCDSNGRA